MDRRAHSNYEDGCYCIGRIIPAPNQVVLFSNTCNQKVLKGHYITVGLACLSVMESPVKSYEQVIKTNFTYNTPWKLLREVGPFLRQLGRMLRFNKIDSKGKLLFPG